MLKIIIIIAISIFATLGIYTGVDKIKEKKVLAGILTIIATISNILILFVFVAVELSLTLSLALWILIGMLDGIIAFLSTVPRDGTGSALFLSLLVVFWTILAQALFSYLILVSNAETHIVYEPYAIEISNDGVILDYDLESMPDEGYEVINKRINKMKEYGLTSYKGIMEIKYSCMVFILQDHHDKCKCTTEKLCKVCKDHVYSVKVIYD